MAYSGKMKALQKNGEAGRVLLIDESSHHFDEEVARCEGLIEYRKSRR